MHINNEGNRVPKGYLEITIAPSNEQLADAIDELEKLTSTLTERVDMLERRLHFANSILSQEE